MGKTSNSKNSKRRYCWLTFWRNITVLGKWTNFAVRGHLFLSRTKVCGLMIDLTLLLLLFHCYFHFYFYFHFFIFFFLTFTGNDETLLRGHMFLSKKIVNCLKRLRIDDWFVDGLFQCIMTDFLQGDSFLPGRKGL